MMNIFAETAPRHWAVGIPVIPLRPGDKMPILTGWTQFADRLPTPVEQDHWLRLYPNANIGLPLGPQSNLVMIDIDTVDEKIRDTLDKVVPPSPWVRIGAKGEMRAYRFNPKIKGFNITHPTHGMIVELLTTGRQCVLPPSIHPDTHRPYHSNVDLIDVLSIIPELPA